MQILPNIRPLIQFGLLLALVTVGLLFLPWQNTQLVTAQNSQNTTVVQGQIKLQGQLNNRVALVTSAEGQQTHPSTDGKFALVLAAGQPYTITVTAPGHLSALATGQIPVESATLNLGLIALPYGEVTGDDSIDIFDMAYITSRMGSSDFLADVNRDGTVTPADINLSSVNYGQHGPISITLDTRLRQLIEQAGLTPQTAQTPQNPAKVELGRALYFDKELSGNRDIACATCHLPSEGTGDALPVSIGTGGSQLAANRTLGDGREFIPRNAPDVFNRGNPEWTSMFWDSRVAGTPEAGFTSPAGDALPSGLDNVLAVQAMFPVTSRDEMRGAVEDADVFDRPNQLAAIDDADFPGIWTTLIARLLAIPEYANLFASAYPDVTPEELGFEHAANAIAAFEIEAFTFTNSPWDNYTMGENTALSATAKQGALLFFGEANCSKCHSGNLFTDQRHHNICAPQIGPGKGAEAPQDFGRGRETKTPADQFAFRTPPLRNVALSGPWMHSGAYNTLEAVVRHHMSPADALRSYNISQLRPDLQETLQSDDEALTAMLANIDPLLKPGLSLSDVEVAQLITFLNALTDPAAADMSNVVPESVPSGLLIDQ